MAAKRFQGMLDRNLGVQENYKPPHQLKNIARTELGPKGGQILIISCSDSRSDPRDIFDLGPYEASVVRIAGGRAAEAIRSISIMGTIAPIELVVVIHHSDCGGLFTTDEQVRTTVGNRNPSQAHLLKDVVYGTYKHLGLDESIRQDVALIRSWPFLQDFTKVVGYAYEVETGKVREVDTPAVL